MTRTLLLGNLPKITSGPNVNRLDRNEAARIRDLSFKQISKAYNNWIQIFRMKGSNLTFEQYLDKMKEISITPDDVGCLRGKYQLSRYNDEGPYTLNSCRFILAEDNNKEQDKSYIVSPWALLLRNYTSEQAREISRANGAKAKIEYTAWENNVKKHGLEKAKTIQSENAKKNLKRFKGITHQ